MQATPSQSTPITSPTWQPTLALLIGASFWGVIWYPFRLLSQAGISGAWSSALTYGVALAIGLLLFGKHLRDLFAAPKLALLLGLSAGICNVSYVVGVTEGEVMRITLLFYLSPLWTVPIAYWLLGEKLDVRGVAVTVIAMIGALTMLWRPELGMPLPSNQAEWLGVLAGITFALNNVVVRKMSGASVAAKSMSIWIGVALVGVIVGLTLRPAPGGGLPHVSTNSLMIVTGISIALVFMSLAIQYGLSNLSANVSAVILLFELIIACIATYLLTNETLRLQDWIGGALIAAAGLLASWQVRKMD
jgi:drug/metabolite transporter (DMT)-like permease